MSHFHARSHRSVGNPRCPTPTRIDTHYGTVGVLIKSVLSIDKEHYFVCGFDVEFAIRLERIRRQARDQDLSWAPWAFSKPASNRITQVRHQSSIRTPRFPARSAESTVRRAR